MGRVWLSKHVCSLHTKYQQSNSFKYLVSLTIGLAEGSPAFKLNAVSRTYLPGLSQKFMDNMDNFVQTCEKSISRPQLFCPLY